MPTCVKCTKILPPQFMIDIDQDAQECIFCNNEIDEVTIVEDATGREEKYSKEDVIKDYVVLLKKMKEIYEKGGIESVKDIGNEDIIIKP